MESKNIVRSYVQTVTGNVRIILGNQSISFTYPMGNEVLITSPAMHIVILKPCLFTECADRPAEERAGEAEGPQLLLICQGQVA